MKGVVLTPQAPACMRISAPSVAAMLIRPESAKGEGVAIECWPCRPRYACELYWDDDMHDRHISLTMWMETAALLPPPLADQLTNAIALHTLATAPHLFKIITPIDVDHLHNLLQSHPNRPLITLICRGFRLGFWPWVTTAGVECPVIVINSEQMLKDLTHVDFVRLQRDTEVALEHFSPVFGPDLLPGMTSIPIRVVLKPHSEKLRLVMDQSSGTHSPNMLIVQDKVKVPLNNLHDLGACLLDACVKYGADQQLIVFKSDVSQAYCRLPMHPLWQLFQVITIDGMCYVGHNNNFGNWAGSTLWGTFMGLVLWIAIVVEGINNMFAYVDNSFSWDFTDNME
jgi:hypothetical protein